MDFKQKHKILQDWLDSVSSKNKELRDTRYAVTLLRAWGMFKVIEIVEEGKWTWLDSGKEGKSLAWCKKKKKRKTSSIEDNGYFHGKWKATKEEAYDSFLEDIYDTYGEGDRILSGDENASRAPRTFEEMELKNAIVGT